VGPDLELPGGDEAEEATLPYLFELGSTAKSAKSTPTRNPGRLPESGSLGTFLRVDIAESAPEVRQ